MALRLRALRGLSLAALALIATIVACRRERAPRYLTDAAFRRAVLEASLTTRDNAYARLRLARWEAWNRLPVKTFDTSGSLLAIGERAFFQYPLQRAPSAALPHLTKNGAMTCATCHAFAGVAGLPNRDLDLGAALLASHPGADPSASAIALSWGKGRIDVSTKEGTEPARIPDLRPVKHLQYLQWSGAVRRVDVHSVAIRIETLIITSIDAVERPPPIVALALATYVESLAEALPALPNDPEGAALFGVSCGRCHRGAGLAGGLVAVGDVGTDPLLARSSDRGTGRYRVPSLRGLGTRGPLMHDGSIASIDRLLDPTREGGHRFGLELDEARRARLVAYLRAL